MADCSPSSKGGGGTASLIEGRYALSNCLGSRGVGE